MQKFTNDQLIDLILKKDKHIQELEKYINALQSAGVDNWDGYDYAMEILNGEEV